jgi:hypothetical protein
MLATAPRATSVFEGRSESKPKPTAQIEAARARATARMAVVCDTRLSPGARLLYVLLDDYAGMAGECWPGQGTIAGKLGVSPRQVKRWLAEVVRADVLTAAKTITGNRYVLCWHHRTLTSQPSKTAPDSVPSVGTSAPPPIEEDFEPCQEPSGPCRCGGSGWITWQGKRRLCGCRDDVRL